MGTGSPPLPDSERFVIGARLGSGAMGVVYRARDRERDGEVALKLLRAPDPAAIYRFKLEFRALADVVHPNLVTLYELVSTGDQWFFTMELIEGTSFLRAVRDGHTGDQSPPPNSLTPGLHQPLAAEPTAETRQLPDGSDGRGSSGSADPTSQPGASGWLDPAARRRRAAPLATPEQFARLRAHAGALAQAITALHRAGQLHRDIKPSNVMVTPVGRVVLLDFGVVAALAEQRDGDGTVRIIGTPVYMAPEQAAGQPLSEASDWYSFGVMLYEAMAGAVPFDGAPHEVVEAKKVADPPALHELAPEVPDDLATLCMKLIQRDPAARPDSAEIRRVFGGPLPTTPIARGEVPLIGRDAQLARLRTALSATLAGQQRTVRVEGGSGMGKSALLHEFVERIHNDRSALVLQGRCYERESVPYKALDSLIDALARYLAALPDAEVTALLPPDISALARIFPVLRRVEAVIDRAALAPTTSDPHETRSRAFTALRALLSRLSTRQPLVLVIDDLQWGDPDSATMLAAVLAPPRPPAVLLIACYRDDDAERSAPHPPGLDEPSPGVPRLAPDAVERPPRNSPTVQRLAPHAPGLDERFSPGVQRSPFLRAFLPTQPNAIELLVQPLSAAQARTLVDQLLADADPPARAQAETIARESAGNPLLAFEMVRFVLDVGDANLGEHQVTFEDLLRARLAGLPAAAVRVLEIVAVAGQPITQKIAKRAAEVDPADHEALASLRAARLVWTRGVRGRDLVETLHDRIRETVVSGLSEQAVRARHLRLARTLLETPPADPEALATHFAGAGDRVRAAQYCIRAAANASEALAFDRAAGLYGRAIQLDPPTGPAHADLWARLGGALARAGRGGEAADAYREAATTAPAGTALDCRRLAAEQLLHCGRVDDGVEALHEVAHAVGIRAPDTPRGALVSLLLRRAWLHVRGLRFRGCDPTEVSRAELARIDVCTTATMSYGMFDPIRGADFQTRHLLLALRAGEPNHLAQALAAEATYSAAARGRTRWQRKVMLMAEALAEQTQDKIAIAHVTVARAIVAYLDGEWEECRKNTVAAELLLRERGSGLAWERVNTQLYQLWSLFYRGQVGELARRVPTLLGDARSRGDLFMVANLCTGLPNLAWLIDDRADEAHAVARDVMTRWSLRGFNLLHYREMVGHAHAYLYQGDGQAAVAALSETWPALERSLLFRIAVIRIEAANLRARCHLAAAIATGDDNLLGLAERGSRRLLRDREPWAGALARSTLAGVAAVRGDRDRAAAGFADAATRLEALGMALYAAAARWRQGQLRGGEAGAAQVGEARSWMARQGIARPAAFIAVLAPMEDS